ncbi:MAG: NnrS family protein, partial [Alphaproteobacteria bacterium]|nr:NnrS family protein [Alphaproteobacteria bacterium]
QRPDSAGPAPFGWADRAALGLTAIALVAWVAVPDAAVTSGLALLAAAAQGVRLARWRGAGAWREPLLWVLHLGYGWLALGFLLLAANGFMPLLPPTAALHALTVGAIGTMTLAVMTRASLGHTGRKLTAGRGTTTIYVLVTIAAVLRLVAPLAGAQYLLTLSLAGAAWSGAFGLFVVLYGPLLLTPRVTAVTVRAP